MDNEFSFTLNLDEEDPHVKPLPYTLRKTAMREKRKHLALPDYYPMYDEALFSSIVDCAKRINLLKSAELKHKYNDELTRIFARRDFKAVMRLYTELIRVQLGEPIETKTRQH